MTDPRFPRANLEAIETDPVLLDLPMPIRTARLDLRPPVPGIGEQVAEALAESWPDVVRFLSWASDREAVCDPAKAEATMRRNSVKFLAREDMMIQGFERSSGEFVLSSGLHRFDWKIRHFEIGYWVRSSRTGEGFASESTRALTLYAFRALAARRVTVMAAENNAGSRRVIEKLGFEREAVHKKAHHLPSGEIVDAFIYARLDDKGLDDSDVEWG